MKMLYADGARGVFSFFSSFLAADFLAAGFLAAVFLAGDCAARQAHAQRCEWSVTLWIGSRNHLWAFNGILGRMRRAKRASGPECAHGWEKGAPTFKRVRASQGSMSHARKPS